MLSAGIMPFGFWDVFLIVLLFLVLFMAWFLPHFLNDLRRGQDGSRNATRSEEEESPDRPKSRDGEPPRLTVKDHFVLWLAEGFGSGLAPVAPGTIGSLVGLVWFVLLVASGDFTLYVLGTVLGLAVSVPLCGAAERILREHDPSSVVLDEIAAVPLCFLPWVTIAWLKLEAMPPVAHFFTAGAWQLTLGLFILFRAFDALKPWPISKIQRLPGGWGVTADDVLAAVAVASLSLIVVR